MLGQGVLRWNPYLNLILGLIVISSVGFSEGYSLKTLQKDLFSIPNNQQEVEVVQVKFITGLRHKREVGDRDFHIIHIQRPSTNSTTVIHLAKTSSIVSSDFKIVVKNGDDDSRVLSSQETKSDCLYHGTIPSGGSAALSACGEHLGFSGLIKNGDEHWIIEPVTKYSHASHSQLSELEHVIRIPGNDSTLQQACKSDGLKLSPEELEEAAERERSKNDEEEEENGNTNSTEESISSNSVQTSMLELNQDETSGDSTLTLAAKKSSKAKSTSGKKIIEIAVFTDVDFYSKMKTNFPKDTLNQIKNYVLTLIHAMDLLFEQKSLGVAIAFRLVHLEIQQKWPTKLNKHSGNADKYLKSFCDYSGDLNAKNKLYDHGLMLTGTDLASSGDSLTAGLAYFSTMCYRYYSCSISEATNFGVVYIITHEIGHSVGMEHDGEGVSKKCDKEKYLMSPTTGGGKITWSTCSSTNLKDFIQYGTSDSTKRAKSIVPSCLSESSRESKSIAYSSSSLPGKKYDANVQCALFKGKEYTPVFSETKPFDNICHLLYCGHNGQAIGIHAALEGTTCATGKICRGGKCVKK